MSDQEQAVQSENPVPSTEQDRGDHFEPEKEPVKDSLSEAEADLDKARKLPRKRPSGRPKRPPPRPKSASGSRKPASTRP